MHEALIHTYPDGRMKPKEAALYLGFSEGTLANWRVTGAGPGFIKKSNRIFYRKQDLDQWLVAGTYTTTAQSRLTPFMGNVISSAKI